MPTDETARLEITTDLRRIDLDVVHRWLSTDAYWALGRTRAIMQSAADGSLNFGALDDEGHLLGYARVITDSTTFAWVCDVYVDPAARGRGVGVQLMEGITAHLEPLALKRTVLTTLDAHGLYERFGFAPLPQPERWMVALGDHPGHFTS